MGGADAWKFPRGMTKVSSPIIGTGDMFGMAPTSCGRESDESDASARSGVGRLVGRPLGERERVSARAVLRVFLGRSLARGTSASSGGTEGSAGRAGGTDPRATFEGDTRSFRGARGLGGGKAMPDEPGGGKATPDEPVDDVVLRI
jgi:hypothetical protein